MGIANATGGQVGLNARWGISGLNTLVFFPTKKKYTHIRRFLEKRARRMMTGRGGLSGNFRVAPSENLPKKGFPREGVRKRVR